MITDAQRAERRKSIGGSDAAAAVNLSPWTSPYKLWLEKTGQRQADDLSDNEFVHFGNVLEDVVATEFMRRTGKRVMRVNQQLTHPEHSWMTANIDRRIVGAGEGIYEGLECKTASIWQLKEWGEKEDQIPIQYLIQVMHYLAVTGWDAWHVAVLIAGNDFRTFKIVRDEEMIEDLIMREREFWDAVLNKQPPEAVSLDDTYMRWPKDYGNPIVASPNARRAYDRLMALREQEDALEEAIIKEKLIIQSWMGDHSTLLDIDGRTPLITWKAQSTKRIDVDKLRKDHAEIAETCSKTTDSRVFRIKGKKTK